MTNKHYYAYEYVLCKVFIVNCDALPMCRHGRMQLVIWVQLCLGAMDFRSREVCAYRRDVEYIYFMELHEVGELDTIPRAGLGGPSSILDTLFICSKAERVPSLRESDIGSSRAMEWLKMVM